MERLIRHKLRKYPQLLGRLIYVEDKSNPKYDLVEKRIGANYKYVPATSESLKKAANESAEAKLPGPGAYEVDDRVLHEKLRDQAWGKMQDERAFNKPVRMDYRKLLHPSLDAVRPDARRAAIQPEHLMTDYEIDKLYQEIVGPGPATFQPEHKLTEKRADVGVVKFKEEIVPKSEPKDDRVALYPSTALTLPSHMTFKYYEESKDIGPQHVPDAVLKPGRWKFYQVDLDAVREQVATNVYLGGRKDLTKDEYREREDFLKVLHTLLEWRNNKKPEAGTYHPEHPDKHVPGTDFDKVEGRDKYFDQDLEDDMDKEGDVLVLDPRQVPDHVPRIEFSKQVGRGGYWSDEDREPDHDELLLEPNADFTKPAQGIGGAIPMAKQVGRPVERSIDDDEHFTADLDTAAIPNDPSRPKVIAPTFSKQGARFDYEPDETHGGEAEIILPADFKPLPKEKVLFKMDKAIERFQYKPKSHIDLDDLPEDGEFRGTDLADLNKAFKANLPHLPVADFANYRSTAQYRVDLPYPKGEGPKADGAANDDDD